MAEGYTDITVVLDRSSSMASAIDSTIAGFNTFLSEQKKAEGKATISLIQFSNEVQTDFEGLDVGDAHELSRATYTPNGMTALNDALGSAILRAEERIARMAEEERPHKVIIVVLTDGEENHSREFGGPAGLSNLKKMIEQRQAEKGWQFLFLGQDLNAQNTAQAYAIPQANAMSYKGNTRGIAHVYAATSNAVADSRSALNDAAEAYDGALCSMDFMEQARSVSTSFRDDDVALNAEISNDSSVNLDEVSSTGTSADVRKTETSST